MSKYHDDGFDPEALSVQVSEMLVATADGSDDLIDSACRVVGRDLTE